MTEYTKDEDEAGHRHLEILLSGTHGHAAKPYGNASPDSYFA